MKINWKTLLYVGIPLIVLGSFVWSYIQGYFVLNVVYFLFIFGILVAFNLYGIKHETRKVDWKHALKNIMPVAQAFKVSHGVQPKVKWGTVRSDMRRYSESGKVWDIQMESDRGNAAVLQDRKTGDILTFDFTIGERQSPVAQGLWETNLPPQYTFPGKSEVTIKKKEETRA